MDKQTLRQYIPLCKEIESLQAEKEAILKDLGGVKPSDGMPHGTGTGDPTGNIAVKINELEQMINESINKRVELRRMIEAAIDSLSPKDGLLMRKRYLEGKKWEQVAVEMNYDYRHVTKIHGFILKKIESL
ncbi:MAG: hypothetical protein HFI72_07415 [Peptococcaceae bacterium]|jgi:DNA-directed RNA polymerase specialized sigma subunit|nr:hypothetical protein [Peptococcaceae bacterium]